MFKKYVVILNITDYFWKAQHQYYLVFYLFFYVNTWTIKYDFVIVIKFLCSIVGNNYI